MRKMDVWVFRIGSAAIAFAASVFGCRYVGKYLHDKEANERAHRVRSEAEDREDALYLSRGFSDTQGYQSMTRHLTAGEMTASYATPHWLEENRFKVAGGIALLVAIVCGESARLFAVKQEAKRRVSGRYRP